MNFRFDFQFNVHRAAPRVSDSSSAAFQGTWSMTYTNGSAYLPPRCLRFLPGSECIFRPPSPNFTNRIHFRCDYNSSNILCKGIFRYVDYDWIPNLEPSVHRRAIFVLRSSSARLAAELRRGTAIRTQSTPPAACAGAAAFNCGTRGP